MIQAPVFVVEVRTPFQDETGYIVEIWWAAVPNEETAKAKVRQATNSSDDIEVIILGRLNPSAAAAEKIKSGDVRSAL